MERRERIDDQPLTSGKESSASEHSNNHRDRDARGLFGMYEAVQADFWKALSDHHRPALKWETQPGTPK